MGQSGLEEKPTLQHDLMSMKREFNKNNFRLCGLCLLFLLTYCLEMDY